MNLSHLISFARFGSHFGHNGGAFAILAMLVFVGTLALVALSARNSNR